MSVTKIPDMWLCGRTCYYERAGYGPREAIKLAVDDWFDGEACELAYMEQQKEKA